MDSMTGFTVLSFLFSILALFGSSPFWLKLLIRYFYSSGIYFFVKEDSYDTESVEPGATIKYREIENLGVTISNQKEKWLKYTIVVYSGHAIKVKDPNETIFSQMKVTDDFSISSVDRPEDTISSIVAKDGNIKGDYRATTSFPLTRPNSQYLTPSQQPLRIALIPKIPLSEFGLPDFFGEAQLKPIIHDYTIENEYINDRIQNYGN